MQLKNDQRFGQNNFEDRHEDKTNRSISVVKPVDNFAMDLYCFGIKPDRYIARTPVRSGTKMIYHFFLSSKLNIENKSINSNF